MALSLIVNMIYSFIDRFFVSRLGDAAIAAMGSSDQVSFFMFTLASGFGVGSGIIVARRFGEGDKHGAQRTATQAVVALFLLGLVITAGLFMAIPHFPAMFNLDPVVSGYAIEYMSALFIGYTANILNFQMFSIIRSTGNAVFPTVILLLTTAINAALAPALIFGVGPIPAMGIRGAGMATAIAQIMGFLIAMWAGMTGKAGLRFDFTNFRFDPKILSRVVVMGVPSSLQMLSVSLSRVLIFKIVGAFGTTVVAAYTLGLQIDMFVFMCVFAMGMSVEVSTGQNLGARKVDRVFAFHKSGVQQITVLMLAFAAVVWLAGGRLISIFTDTPATLREATTYLHTTVIGYVFFAIGVVTVRVISGAGASFTSLFVTSGALLGLQLPLAFVLARYTSLGQNGVWIAGVVAYVVYACVAYGVLRRRTWLKVQI